jgi:outer membrane autotransporter protein
VVAAAPPAGADPVPLYRPEVPVYTQAKALARQTALEEVSTYHDRRGEQRNWSQGENSGWLRLYRNDGHFDWDGDVYNRFDGHISGFQLGGNYFTQKTSNGLREWGLFIGSSRANGDVRGFARGFMNFHAGINELETHYVGGYMTDYQSDQSYLDIVFKAGYLQLESRSVREIGDTIYGPQLTLSAEKGFTFAAGERVNLEPQLQAIINYSNLDAYNDGISRVEPDMTPEVTLRAGLRGYNSQGDNQLYLFGNLWRTLGGHDEMLFDNRIRLDAERSAAWAEIGAGVVLLKRQSGSAFFNLSYQRSIDSLDWEGGSANLGFNWSW